jgi:hypothetical protein
MAQREVTMLFATILPKERKLEWIEAELCCDAWLDVGLDDKTRGIFTTALWRDRISGTIIDIAIDGNGFDMPPEKIGYCAIFHYLIPGNAVISAYNRGIIPVTSTMINKHMISWLPTTTDVERAIADGIRPPPDMVYVSWAR